MTIGFAPESVSVRVLEGDPARLCAEVLSGNLGRDVSVDFSTRDGTAECKMKTTLYCASIAMATLSCAVLVMHLCVRHFSWR